MVGSCPFAALTAIHSDFTPELPTNHPAIHARRRSSASSQGRIGLLNRAVSGDLSICIGQDRPTYRSGGLEAWSEAEMCLLTEHRPNLKEITVVLEAKQPEYFGKMLLEELFEANPSMKHMLEGKDMGTVMNFLGRIPAEILRIVMLPTKELFRKDVYRLALRHIDYGVEPEHRTKFIHAFLKVVERILFREDCLWTRAVEKAWLWAIEYILDYWFEVSSEIGPKVNMVRKSFQTMLAKIAMLGEPSQGSEKKTLKSGRLPTMHRRESPKRGLYRSAETFTSSSEISGKKVGFEVEIGEDLDAKGMALERLGCALSSSLQEALGNVASGFSWSIHHGRKLAKTLQHIVDSATRPELLEQGLWQIAQRHLEIGVDAEQMAVFEAVLFRFLEKWIPLELFLEARSSWEWLWGDVARVFLDVLVRWKMVKASLETSWDILLEKAGSALSISSIFYERLFDESPLLQEIFQRQNDAMIDAFAAALHLIIQCSRDSTMFDNELEDLAVRHCKFDLQSWHFDVFGKVLLSTLQDIAQEDWTEDFQVAWEFLYNSIQLVFLRVIETSRSSMMQALVRCSVPAIRASLEHAPRGERANRILAVRAGRRNLSPILWVLRDGRREIAELFINDLFAIRADRSEYYFGMEDVWIKCPMIMSALIEFDITLVEPFLDGHLWVSRHTENGFTRVNLWIKHLYGDPYLTDNVFNSPIGVIVRTLPDSCLHIMSHPAVTAVVNLKWRRFARRKVILINAAQASCLASYTIVQALERYERQHTLTAFTLLWLIITVFLLLRILITFVKQCRNGRYVSISLASNTCVVPQCLAYPFVQLRLLCCILSLFTTVLIICKSLSDDLLGGAGVPPLLAGCVSFLQWIQITEFFKLNDRLASMFFLGRAMLIDALRFMMVLIVWLLAIGGALLHFTNGTIGNNEFSTAYNLLAAVLGFGGDAVDLTFYEDDTDITTTTIVKILFLVCMWVSIIPIFNLMVSAMVSTYTKFEEFTLALAIRSRASAVLDAEDELSDSIRRWHYDSLEFDRPLPFSELDKGPPGGISFHCTGRELADHPAYERQRDKVIFFSGVCGYQHPWPPHNVPALTACTGRFKGTTQPSTSAKGEKEDHLMQEDIAEIKRLLRHQHEKNVLSSVSPSSDDSTQTPRSMTPLGRVASHSDTAPVCLLVIEGKVYDVGPYLAKHPGGMSVLQGASGTDATALFLSHRSMEKVRKALCEVDVCGEHRVSSRDRKVATSEEGTTKHREQKVNSLEYFNF